MLLTISTSHSICPIILSPIENYHILVRGVEKYIEEEEGKEEEEEEV